ncbi:MAG: alanine--glyoxylate aminotransferase family protein, partial [Vulcanimicrobiaceae bacterium]
FYLDLVRAHTFARDGGTPWTPPLSILFALDVALDRYHAEGAPHAWARHARNAEAIRAFAQAAGLRVFSQPNAHSVTVVAIAAPDGIDASTVIKELRERHGVVLGGGQADLKGKIFRMGTMGDITADDVLAALAAFEQALAAQGFPARDGAFAAARSRLTEGRRPAGVA